MEMIYDRHRHNDRSRGTDTAWRQRIHVIPSRRSMILLSVTITCPITRAPVPKTKSVQYVLFAGVPSISRSWVGCEPSSPPW